MPLKSFRHLVSESGVNSKWVATVMMLDGLGTVFLLAVILGAALSTNEGPRLRCVIMFICAVVITVFTKRARARLTSQTAEKISAQIRIRLCNFAQGVPAIPGIENTQSGFIPISISELPMLSQAVGMTFTVAGSLVQLIPLLLYVSYLSLQAFIVVVVAVAVIGAVCGRTLTRLESLFRMPLSDECQASANQQTIRLSLFGHSVFFAALAANILILPAMSAAEPTVVIRIVAVLFFTYGSMMDVMRGIAPAARANVVAEGLQSSNPSKLRLTRRD